MDINKIISLINNNKISDFQYVNKRLIYKYLIFGTKIDKQTCEFTYQT